MLCFYIGKLTLSKSAVKSIRTDCRTLCLHRPLSAAYKTVQICSVSSCLHQAMGAIVITGYYAIPACYTNSVSKAGGPEALLIGNQ